MFTYCGGDGAGDGAGGGAGRGACVGARRGACVGAKRGQVEVATLAPGGRSGGCLGPGVKCVGWGQKFDKYTE